MTTSPVMTEAVDLLLEVRYHLLPDLCRIVWEYADDTLANFIEAEDNLTHEAALEWYFDYGSSYFTRGVANKAWVVYQTLHQDVCLHGSELCLETIYCCFKHGKPLLCVCRGSDPPCTPEKCHVCGYQQFVLTVAHNP